MIHMHLLWKSLDASAWRWGIVGKLIHLLDDWFLVICNLSIFQTKRVEATVGRLNIAYCVVGRSSSC